MNFSETCIKKPVLTTVFSLVLILIGFLAYQQLDLRSDPKIFRPRISITVSVPGSSPQYVDQNVVTPLESQLQSISNVSLMTSESSQNQAQVTLHFKNISQQEFITAQSEVNQAVSRTHLPDNIGKPQIRAGGRDGDQLMFLSVYAGGMNPHELVSYVYNNIRQPLTQVAGVGVVNQYSMRNALRVSLAPRKMAQLGISAQDVINALGENDIAVSAGEIVNRDQQMSVNLLSKPKNVAEFKKIIVSRSRGRIIRLQDIAKVAISGQSFSGGFATFDGKQSVAINIVASDSANPIKTGKLLRKEIKRLKQQLPPGMSINVLYDSTIFLQHSVHELFQTIFEAVLFVAIITFLFLGSVRLSFIPVVTIPVCIVSSFLFIWLLGFSINLMTLLALVIAVGLVVDDAIVVLENSHRHLEQGKSPMYAAITSMKEVTFPVIGMTLSIIAVYLPTAFMKGKTAVYFQQFSFTLAGAVLVSGFVALTLTPMMCARVMTAGSTSKMEKVVERIFYKFRGVYSDFLSTLLLRRWLVMILFVLLFGCGYFILKKIPSSLLPTNYIGFLVVPVDTVGSSSVAHAKKVNSQVMSVLRKIPEIGAVLSFGGGRGGSSEVLNIVKLRPQYSGSASTLALASKTQQKLGGIIDANVAVIPMDLNKRGGGGNTPGALDFYVQGYIPYTLLVKATGDYVNALTKTGLFSSLQNELQYSSQQYDIHINRTMASQLSVPMDNINTTIQTYLGGHIIEDGFSFGGLMYPVYIQLPQKDLKDLTILKHIFVKNASGQLVNISRLLTTKAIASLSQRTHVNSIPSGEVVAVPRPGVSSGQLLAAMQVVAKQVLPAGVTLAYSQHMLDTIHGSLTMVLIFGLGIMFIYLVFAALFESFIDPFIILFTVPLCIVGALLLLYLIGGTLNIYTGIGLVTLIGLVSKHGVLITHFANQLCREGKTAAEAARTAASIRLRPILMTTATMVMGSLPLILASGSGSEGRIQVGTVIIAGLLFGTFFSLIVVPVVYTLVAGWRRPTKSLDS